MPLSYRALAALAASHLRRRLIPSLRPRPSSIEELTNRRRERSGWQEMVKL